MTQEEIFERIKEAIVGILIRDGDKIDEDQIEKNSNLEDLNIDSFDRVEITIALEEEFGLDSGEIRDEEAVRWQKVEDIIQCISERKSFSNV